jgi:hypothetical protein
MFIRHRGVSKRWMRDHIPADTAWNRSSIWTETVLYRFLGGNDGEAPLSNLLFFNGAVLYGTTKSGGSSETCTADGGYIGCGTVIKFLP